MGKAFVATGNPERTNEEIIVTPSSEPSKCFKRELIITLWCHVLSSPSIQNVLFVPAKSNKDVIIFFLVCFSWQNLDFMHTPFVFVFLNVEEFGFIPCTGLNCHNFLPHSRPCQKPPLRLKLQTEEKKKSRQIETAQSESTGGECSTLAAWK